MRVLFVLPLMSLMRHFESVVLTLADAGHDVVIATPGRRNDWPIPRGLSQHPRISEVRCPQGRSDEWKDAATDFRLIVDSGHYLGDTFDGADKLRERAFRMLAETISGGEKRHLTARCASCNTKVVDHQFARLVPSLGGTGSDRLEKLAQLIEQVIPSDPRREEFLLSHRPDMLVVSPLIFLASDQPDWVKSARALSIPVGFPVFSWDNLTTKGTVHVLPDQVFVWNDIQKREAIELHGIPPERIVITGAPRFDAFIELKPSVDREQYCAALGLDPSVPIITYLCSSEFVAGREVGFVERWIQEIRTAPTLARCNVVIRPHPRSLHQWRNVDVGPWGEGVALAIGRRLNADQSLYDTLHHSAVVVGLNTSAQLEAAILGKPVLTLLAPGFERGQQGTVHFRYLLRSEGGFVEVAKDFDEHRRQMADAVAGRYDADRVREFIQRFIRPAGWGQPATPILADAIIRLAPAPPSLVRRLFRSSR